MNELSSAGPASAPSMRTKPSDLAVLSQLAALVLSVPAVVIGLFMAWSTAFPPPCGDWSGFTPLGVLECWVADLPIGVLNLAMGLFVRKGAPGLRKMCILASLVTLSLPMIAQLLLLRWHCP